jgi:hypothetical protein
MVCLLPSPRLRGTRQLRWRRQKNPQRISGAKPQPPLKLRRAPVVFRPQRSFSEVGSGFLLISASFRQNSQNAHDGTSFHHPAKWLCSNSTYCALASKNPPVPIFPTDLTSDPLPPPAPSLPDPELVVEPPNSLVATFRLSLMADCMYRIEAITTRQMQLRQRRYSTKLEPLHGDLSFAA